MERKVAKLRLRYGEVMHTGDTDFEFERRFLVTELPSELLVDNTADLIVQTYFLAEDGYALRVRLQATQPDVTLPLNMDGKEAIRHFIDYFDLCVITAKGPHIGGTRYEAERPLDVGVGAQMCLRGGKTLAKRRYGVWLNEDGWVIDQFAGANQPLVVAECERTSPVVDLQIPAFCRAEITGNPRFSNDELAKKPYSEWSEKYLVTLGDRDSSFESGFGRNRMSPF